MYEATGIASPPVINLGGLEDLFVAQFRVLENASLRLDHLKTRHEPFSPTVIMNHQPTGYSFSSVWRATLSNSLSPPGSEEATAISTATVETSACCHHDQFLAAQMYTPRTRNSRERGRFGVRQVSKYWIFMQTQNYVVCNLYPAIYF